MEQLITIDWLVVPTPLKNMSSSVGIVIPIIDDDVSFVDYFPIIIAIIVVI